MTNKAIRITKAVINPARKFGDMATIDAVFEDGTQKRVLKYFDDEVSFSEAEVIGLTEDEVAKLFHEKDVAYLRS